MIVLHSSLQQSNNNDGDDEAVHQDRARDGCSERLHEDVDNQDDHEYSEHEQSQCQNDRNIGKIDEARVVEGCFFRVCDAVFEVAPEFEPAPNVRSLRQKLVTRTQILRQSREPFHCQ